MGHSHGENDPVPEPVAAAPDPLTWVRLGSRHTLSWHIVGVEGKTLCGRKAKGDAIPTADLPMSQPSCENCARISLHRQD
jgi:hypothetical protein